MALKLQVIILPGDARAIIEKEAHAAFPRECCGLIEGVRDGDIVRALSVHPVRNLANEPDRFELDPQAHFGLLRRLRGTGREIVGCYHSHPDGLATLSPRDRENAGEDDFVWLVAGVTAEGLVAISGHVRTNGAWREIALRKHETCASAAARIRDFPAGTGFA